MAHKEQRDYFRRVKKSYPQFFEGVRVLDCGSLDVNGSIKEFFTDCEYVGIDIVDGKNVDHVSKTHEYKDKPFDVVVSGEMLEHDEHWKKSLRNMYDLLKDGGLMAISAAGKGRPEHGTRRTGRGDIWGTNPDYYRNILEEDFEDVFDLDKEFAFWETEYCNSHKDVYFHGIKRVSGSK